MARFNVLTFSTGATFAVLFMVLLVGLYPRVTASLFTHFFYFIAIAMLSMVLALWGMYSYYYKWDRYSVLNKKRHIALGFTMGFFIWVWMVIMTGIDTYMVTGGGPGAPRSPRATSAASGPLSGDLQPDVRRDGPAPHLRQPLVAGLRPRRLGRFMYIRSKTAEDKAFYDWSSAVGLTWGVGFLLLQPIVGFTMVYAMKVSAPGGSGPGSAGLTRGSPRGRTSNLLVINLIMVVVLFVLSNVAMYLGAERNPDRAGRVPIRFFTLVAAVAGCTRSRRWRSSLSSTCATS